MGYIITIIIVVILLVVGFKFHELMHTEEKSKTIFVIKNVMTPDWVGSCGRIFDLTSGEAFQGADLVEIVEITTYVFGRKTGTRLEVSKSYMCDDMDGV